MTTIVDKAKLVVVHRDSPDIETELGTYPWGDCSVPDATSVTWGPRAQAAASSLRFRPGQVEIAFGAKYVAIKAGDPLPPARGDI
jgi:hypothetical protein